MNTPESKYVITFDGTHILFLAELIAIGYASRILTQFSAQNIGTIFLLNGFEEALNESLRTLLREPLKDPLFRKCFNAHFAKHEHPGIQSIALPWMEKILVWEE